MRRPLLLLLLLWPAAACHRERDTGGETAADTDTDADTGDTDAAPPDTGTPATDARALQIRWRLHEEIASIVYVTWDQVVPGTSHVEVDVDGTWVPTPSAVRAAGPAEQIAMGIPFGTSFGLRVMVDDGSGAWTSSRREAATGALPSGFPRPRLVAAEPSAWEPSGRFLVGSVNASEGGWVAGVFWKWIMDRQGRVVWALATPDHRWTLWMTPARNGADLLWDEFTYWSDWDSGLGSRVHRRRLDGTEVAIYATPGGHHAFVELPGDVLVWGAADPVSETLQERASDGTERTLWSCSDFHGEIGVAERCQSNALFWDEAADTFLYSFYTTDSVLEVAHATGEVVRVLGHLPGAYTFDPEASAFWWQHGVTRTPSGTLLLSTHASEGDDEAVAREYAVDDEARVLRQVWSFGEGLGTQARTNGEALRLPGGNTLHNYGSGGVLKEVTPEGRVVWQVTFDSNRLLGHTTWLGDLYALVP